MSFKARLKNPKQFANIVAVLNEFVDVVTLDVSNHGIAVTTMDTSHVFVIDLVLLADKAFVEFECERRTSIGLKVDALVKIMRSVKKGDMLLFGSNDEDTVYINMFKTEGVHKKTRFVLSQMMVLNQDQIQIPDRSYSCEVMLSSALFHEVCTELKAMGDQLRISVSHDEITFDAPEGNLEAKITLSPASASRKERGPLAIVCSESRSLLFKNKFLQKMGKAAKLLECDEILLQMDKDAPLSVSFTLDDDAGGLNFYLAPLIDD